MSDRPWMDALESQFSALKNYPDDDGISGLGKMMLRDAAAFAWETGTAQAVQFASRTVPSLTHTPTLPEQSCFWWFDRPLTFGDDEVRALLVARYDNGDLEILLFDETGPRMSPRVFLSTSWVSNSTLLGLVASAVEAAGNDKQRRAALAVEEAARFVAAACAWLSQRIAVSAIATIERHARKRLAREHDAYPSNVKVIQLRRKESSGKTGDGSDADVPWQCRWVVNGHFRLQPYRSTGEHKLIWIMPYVKGPSDKPLRVPNHTVYAVAR